MKKTLLSYLRLITYCIPAISTGFLALAVFAVLVTGNISIQATIPLLTPLFYIIMVCIVGLLALLTAMAILQFLMRLDKENELRHTANLAPFTPVRTGAPCAILSAALLILFDQVIHGRFFLSNTFYFHDNSISVAISFEGIVFIALVILIVLRQIFITYKYFHHHKSADANTEP